MTKKEFEKIEKDYENINNKINKMRANGESETNIKKFYYLLGQWAYLDNIIESILKGAK